MRESTKSVIFRYMVRLVIHILTLAAFLFILFLPAVLTLFGETDILPGKISPNAFFSGDFQSEIEQRFAESHMGRDITRLYIKFTGKSTETTGTETPETKPTEPADLTIQWDDSNPLYAEINRLRAVRLMVEPTGFKGAPTVIIGKSGYLYENGYINEFFGYSEMYREVTRERVVRQVEMLEYIAKRLKQEGHAFTFVLTPSKASQYPDAIPDWYKNQNKAPDSYVRPYDYFIETLADSDVPYIDSASLYAGVGLQETFSKTGTHWNKPAAYETSREIMAEYERQTGIEIRRLAADKLVSSESPPGYGNPEQDILSFVISGIKRSELILDDLYYWPDVYVENEECKKRISILLQGGSFAHDFSTYFTTYGIASRITRLYYNGFPNDNINAIKNPSRWQTLLNNIDYVIFECNEQFVRSLGGSAPDWSRDKDGYQIGPDCYESLYNYLKSTEQ